MDLELTIFLFFTHVFFLYVKKENRWFSNFYVLFKDFVGEWKDIVVELDVPHKIKGNIFISIHLLFVICPRNYICS